MLDLVAIFKMNINSSLIEECDGYGHRTFEGRFSYHQWSEGILRLYRTEVSYLVITEWQLIIQNLNYILKHISVV